MREPDPQDGLPLPPEALMQRVGHIGTQAGVAERYLLAGAALHREIEDAVGEHLTLDGGRILDFGCGAGRVLRHFVPGGARTQLHGTEVDEVSVGWAREAFASAATIRQTGEVPGLPYPDGYFDLVYALSVFSHLTEHWAGWLLECHRVLKPGGILYATTLGAGMSEAWLHEPWREDRIGMTVSGAGRPWDEGGPITVCSDWWVRAHWGRLFDVLSPAGTPPLVPGRQDVWVLRRKEVSLDVPALEAWEPEEPREVLAAQHNARRLWRELEQERTLVATVRDGAARDREQLVAIAEHHEGQAQRWQEAAGAWEEMVEERTRHVEALSEHADDLVPRVYALTEQVAALTARVAEHDQAAHELRSRHADLRRRYDDVVTSASWRATTPLRRVAARLRAARR